MFQVEWVESALDELTDIWLNADSSFRSVITAAVHEVEQSLRSNPDQQGESRPNDTRILFVAPLGFHVRVDNNSRTATVLQVWLFRQRSS